MLQEVKRFLKDESGTAAVEYGIIASGISVAIIPSVKELGTKLVEIFSLIEQAV